MAAAGALEEQRSEKYRHGLIAVVSIGVRAGQLDGAGPMPGLSSRLVSTCETPDLFTSGLSTPTFIAALARDAVRLGSAGADSMPRCRQRQARSGQTR